MNHRSKPTTLVCTVGTSLVHSNLKNFSREHFLKYLSPDDARALASAGLAVESAELDELLGLVAQESAHANWPVLGKILTRFPPEIRLLGAEINSVAAMFEKGILPSRLGRIILLISDTEAGKNTGALLRAYFSSPECPLPSDQMLLLTIEDMQDADPSRFQHRGLPNLIRMLGELAQKWSAYAMAINATGGYKAQIAFAVIFGQAMGIPVYYKHEQFHEIISFPQVPFTMDLRLIEHNLRFWAMVTEQGASFSYAQLSALITPGSTSWEAMLPLLEVIEEGEQTLYALSALGLIYWEAFCAARPHLTLQPVPASTNKGCHFRDDHYPKGFRIWADRVNKRHDFITGCHSLSYDGQGGLKPGFYEERGKIIGVFKDSDGFAARLEIRTTCACALERRWAVEALRSSHL